MSQQAVPRELRILGLSQGDPRAAMSGVAGHLFDALDRRFQVVEAVDYSPQGIHRLRLAALSARPTRFTWRQRFHTSRLAHAASTASMTRCVAALAEPFDVALQVHGWVHGQPRPYAVYIDQTRLMAERGWPGWIPMVRRERDELIRLESEMYRQAAHVFTMGEPSARSAVEDYGADPARVTAVGGGLNLTTLPDVRPTPATRRVVFIGRDFDRKGGETLLQAFALVRREVPDAELDVVGPPGTFDQPGVNGRGRLPHAETMALVRDARVFCMPSLYEPWGLAFGEAMAFGVPCVGTTVQSIPEILGDGEAGLLVPPGDPAALAGALVRLLTDDALADAVGAAGRHHVEAVHSWDAVAARMEPGLRAAARRTA